MGNISGLNEKFVSKAVAEIVKLQVTDERLLVAIAGPPAVGKTTISESLVEALNVIDPNSAALLPMDGFHLDNDVLSDAGLLDRKGSPPTFDFHGLQSLLDRIKNDGIDHYVPLFDRTRDLSVAGARKISKSIKIVVVEGNYLLLDQNPWNELKSEFDHSIFIDAPLPELRSRLIQRWLNNGHDMESATKRAEHNDIPNAEIVVSNQLAADQLFEQDGPSEI